MSGECCYVASAGVLHGKRPCVIAAPIAAIAALSTRPGRHGAMDLDADQVEPLENLKEHDAMAARLCCAWSILEAPSASQQRAEGTGGQGIADGAGWPQTSGSRQTSD